MRLVLVVLAIAAMYGLFLPFYGPALNHHFAEQMPDHAHLYLGQASADSTQPYQVRHTHLPLNHAHQNGASDASGDGQSAAEMVFLPCHDSLGTVTAQLTPPSIHTSSDFASLKQYDFTFGVPSVGFFYRETSLKPLDRPPIA